MVLLAIWSQLWLLKSWKRGMHYLMIWQRKTFLINFSTWNESWNQNIFVDIQFCFNFYFILIHVFLKASRNKSWNPFNVQKKIKNWSTTAQKEIKEGTCVERLKEYCKRFWVVSQSTPATLKVISYVLKNQIKWNLLRILSENLNSSIKKSNDDKIV